ncbi:hypothetical protein TIFTF001_027876 [Ficus carica]|uniref:Uncharacterized protein n=1 Tax=Ficus carica TaxID=3494 RepID=A0AA88IVQ3_FICCA|nr:hypothetical protein TIFTF001_027876 [Ficus carica]
MATIVWSLYENNRSLELVDPTLEEFDETEATRLIRVALLCIQASPTMRPPMSRVVGMLAGDMEIDIARSKPTFFTDLDFEDTTSIGFTAQNDTSSSITSKDSSFAVSRSM